MQPSEIARPEPARLNVLGVGVSTVTRAEVMRIVLGWIEDRSPHYLCAAGAHGIVESQAVAGLKRVFNSAGLTVPDGMPLVWLSHWGGYPQVERIYGPQLMLDVFEQTQGTGVKHYLYGGPPGLAEQLESRLRERYPGTNIVGVYSPPFRPLTPKEDQEIIDRIDRTGADIVWVGLGCPKQEVWMAEHCGRLQAPVLMGVGAAFDFITGNKRQAPAWMQRKGLEWLFRLMAEPRRLWKRYIIYNPIFIFQVILQALKLTRCPLER